MLDYLKDLEKEKNNPDVLKKEMTEEPKLIEWSKDDTTEGFGY
jgi:hypothetical protein